MWATLTLSRGAGAAAAALIIAWHAHTWLAAAALMCNKVWLTRSQPCLKRRCVVESFDDKQQFGTPLLHPKGDEEAQNATDVAGMRTV